MWFNTERGNLNWRNLPIKKFEHITNNIVYLSNLNNRFIRRSRKDAQQYYNCFTPPYILLLPIFPVRKLVNCPGTENNFNSSSPPLIQSISLFLTINIVFLYSYQRTKIKCEKQIFNMTMKNLSRVQSTTLSLPKEWQNREMEADKIYQKLDKKFKSDQYAVYNNLILMGMVGVIFLLASLINTIKASSLANSKTLEVEIIKYRSNFFLANAFIICFSCYFLLNDDKINRLEKLNTKALDEFKRYNANLAFFSGGESATQSLPSDGLDTDYGLTSI